MDWLDRPIRPGDRFVPLTPCRVISKTNVWILKPDGTRGGRWVRAFRLAGQETPPEPAGAGWQPYEWIGRTDGSDYRLRIGVGSTGQLTGIVEGVKVECGKNTSG